MFSITYKLRKVTPFTIFLFQLWAFINGELIYTCFELNLMQKATFIKRCDIITALSVKIQKKKNLCVAVWLFGHYLSQLAGPNIFSASVTIPLPFPIPHMPCHKVSRDLKAQIPALFHQHGFKVKEICGILDVKKSVVYQTLSFASAYGVSYNPFANKSG